LQIIGNFASLKEKGRMKRILALIIIGILCLSMFVVLAPKAKADSSPIITAVSPLLSDITQTIVIQGSGFGNTPPSTVPVGDGSVDTVLSTVTPSIVINDNVAEGGIGPESWAAGHETSSNFDDIGIFLVSWSDSQIVVGGFGSALGNATNPSTWNIAVGDPIEVTVFGPNNDGQAKYDLDVSSLPLTAWGSTLWIASGSGTFASISTANPAVTVSAGQMLSGTVTLDADNNIIPNAVVPLIGTPSWGDDSSRWWLIDSWLPVGSSTWTTNVQFSAPLQAGTYYVIFAFRGELTGDQVASATNWPVGHDVWGDGNDIAEFSSTQIAQAQQNGVTVDNWLYTNGYMPTYVPACAITVVVGPVVQRENVIFQDDFESYPVGAFPPPSSGWQIVWNGAGDQYQVITDAYSHSPTKSLQLEGSVGWSAVVKKDFSSSSNLIGYEAYLMASPGGGSSVAFCNIPIATWGRYYAMVALEPDGYIWACENNSEGAIQLQLYQPYTWYDIRVVVDRNARLYNVTIDDVLRGENIPIYYDPWEILSLQFQVGWINTVNYFDDVKVFEIISSTSTSVTCSPNPASAGQQVTCTATVTGSNPTGIITWSTSSSSGSFTSTSTQLTSGVASTNYADTSVGTVTITASYSGDANNAPSAGSTTLNCVRASPAEFNMHWNSQYYGVTAGQTTSFVIYLDYSAGFTGLVNLSFQGLPAGCTGEFDIAGAQAPSVQYRTLFVTTPSTLNNGTYIFTVEGESDGISQTIPVTLTVGTGEITGVVYRDDNGKAVSGATISYYATQNYINLYQTSVTSDSNGELTLVNIPFNVDNEVYVTATGFSPRDIDINIMNQPETQLNVSLSTSLASSWMMCPDFSISALSVSFSQYLLPFAEVYNAIPFHTQISIDSINSLPPVNLYMITQSSSANQAEFAQSLSQFLGITAPTGYNPACVWIFELPFLQTINALFSTTIEGPITISIPSLGGVNLILSAQSISTTPNGNIVLAFTFSKVTDNTQGIVDTLEAIARDLVSLAKEPDLQAIVTTGADILNSITETLGDATVSVITSDLSQIGQLNSYTLLDIVSVANTISTLTTAGGILMKLIDLLCPGTEAAATAGLDAPADVQSIVHALDLGLEILPYLPGMSFLQDNTLYQLFMTGESMIVSAVDPNGTTLIPSIFGMDGSLVLGYNFTSGGIIYASPQGILIPAAGNWLALLNESASNPVDYTICLTTMGGSAAVPYNLQILSSNQSVAFDGYSGMILGGTSTIIPVSISPDGTFVQQVHLKPSVSVSETGNVYDFVATATLSNGSLTSVSNAFLIINGSQYEMNQDSSSTFKIQISVNLPGNFTYFVYMISPNVPGGFASGVIIQYELTFSQTGVGSDFPGTIVSVDGSNCNISMLPASFWWYNGSTHSFAFQSPLLVASGAKEYDWNSTSGLSTLQSGSINATATGNVTGNYVTRVHDVAVTNVTADRTWVYKGNTANISVTVWDNGDFAENVTVTLYYNMTGGEVAGTQNVSLTSGESVTLLFVWNTAGVPICYTNYTLTAVATIPADYTPADNTLVGGNITVRFMGDVNGTGTVDISDISVAAAAFGSHPGMPNWNAAADVNGDGVVDIMDIALIASHFGQHYP
jgi:hypothetical protein